MLILPLTAVSGFFSMMFLLFQPNHPQKRARKRKWKCSRSCTLNGRVKTNSKTLSTKPFPDSTLRFIFLTMSHMFLIILFVCVVYYTVFRTISWRKLTLSPDRNQISLNALVAGCWFCSHAKVDVGNENKCSLIRSDYSWSQGSRRQAGRKL